MISKNKKPVGSRKKKTGCFQVSLRPYNGELYVARDQKSYEDASLKLFGEPDKLTPSQEGRFRCGGKTGESWKYLIWAGNSHTLPHEVSHVILHVFQRIGITVNSDNDEPFCYMLSQILLDISQEMKP